MSEWCCNEEIQLTGWLFNCFRVISGKNKPCPCLFSVSHVAEEQSLKFLLCIKIPGNSQSSAFQLKYLTSHTTSTRVSVIMF